VRMRLVAPDGRRGEAGDRGPAARQAGPQHGGRHQRPGARPGQTRVIHQTSARPPCGKARVLTTGGDMKFLYLLYADESKMPAADSPRMEQQQVAFGRYYEELSGRGMFKGGDPVQPSKTATTVRVRNGSTKTASGPATTGADQIIGFYVVEAKNQDEAIAYAAKVPSAAVGSIEVRPIISSS